MGKRALRNAVRRQGAAAGKRANDLTTGFKKVFA